MRAKLKVQVAPVVKVQGVEMSYYNTRTETTYNGPLCHIHNSPPSFHHETSTTFEIRASLFVGLDWLTGKDTNKKLDYIRRVQ